MNYRYFRLYSDTIYDQINHTITYKNTNNRDILISTSATLDNIFYQNSNDEFNQYLQYLYRNNKGYSLIILNKENEDYYLSYNKNKSSNIINIMGKTLKTRLHLIGNIYPQDTTTIIPSHPIVLVGLTILDERTPSIEGDTLVHFANNEDFKIFTIFSSLIIPYNYRIYSKYPEQTVLGNFILNQDEQGYNLVNFDSGGGQFQLNDIDFNFTDENYSSLIEYVIMNTHVQDSYQEINQNSSHIYRGSKYFYYSFEYKKQDTVNTKVFDFYKDKECQNKIKSVNTQQIKIKDLNIIKWSQPIRIYFKINNIYDLTEQTRWMQGNNITSWSKYNNYYQSLFTDSYTKITPLYVKFRVVDINTQDTIDTSHIRIHSMNDIDKENYDVETGLIPIYNNGDIIPIDIISNQKGLNQGSYPQQLQIIPEIYHFWI